ncbi:MAG: hypothetical protein JSV25_01790 [Spirochaetota bacterium]|nr:MAG: hypothetical protein JSV25_01790 [Spirochaetota bacterium]
MRIGTVLLIGVALLLLVSCATISRINIELPEGFAEKRTRPVLVSSSYMAVSPEGMLFEVRSVKNYPPQGLDFWQEALETHLKREGYLPKGKEVRFDTSREEGILFEWTMPYGSRNYTYLTAIIPVKKRILVCEVAGESSIYTEYREEILKSLRSISFR